MSAQDIWARKYHELWEKLEKITKDSFCTDLWKWIVSLVTQQCSLSNHANKVTTVAYLLGSLQTLHT